MIGFFVSYLLTMFDDTNTTELVISKLVLNKVDELPNGAFIFGFRVLDQDSEVFWDTSILNWNIITTKKVWDKNSQSYKSSETTYFLENCQDYYEASLNATLVLDEQQYARADLNSYKCPVNLLSKFIRGTQFEETYVETALSIEVCDSTDPSQACADDATIEAAVENLRIEFFYLNTNFDGSNIETPLVNYLDFSLKNGLEYGRAKSTVILLDPNVGILNDSYLGSSPELDSYLTFYQSSSSFGSEYARADSKTLMRYTFTENTVYREYQRTKFNLIDILSELGGLFNSFYILGFAFTISFSYNLFLSSIIRVVYHFPARFDSEIKKKKKKTKQKDVKSEGTAGTTFDENDDKENGEDDFED